MNQVLKVLIIEVNNLWKKFKLHANRTDSFSKMFNPILRFSHRKDNEEFWALKDISFNVEEGKSLGVIGVNGSGKSTLLKLLTGTLRPTKGQIIVRGKRSSLIELGVGFHPDFSGRDNVYLNGMILGLSRAQIKTKFNDIISFSELEEFIDVPVKYYSSGMQARLGFAVATAANPDILIVDEVLAVGDSGFQRKCKIRIHEMQGNGVSIILVSHGMSDVEEVCHYTLWIHKGEEMMFGKSKDIVKQYNKFHGTV